MKKSTNRKKPEFVFKFPALAEGREIHEYIGSCQLAWHAALMKYLGKKWPTPKTPSSMFGG